MTIEIGTKVTTYVVTGEFIKGEVVKLLDNTFIVLSGTERYLVRYSDLQK